MHNYISNRLFIWAPLSQVIRNYFPTRKHVGHRPIERSRNTLVNASPFPRSAIPYFSSILPFCLVTNFSLESTSPVTIRWRHRTFSRESSRSSSCLPFPNISSFSLSPLSQEPPACYFRLFAASLRELLVLISRTDELQFPNYMGNERRVFQVLGSVANRD